ncbi:hypothetical protein ACGFWE_14945 [Streptomyces sp. NPDC048523]|uniref:hypothetical protein n=1 Tax=Streptomyces sp. NPDC048523 TaxID=3365567 RepID=UPI00371F4770
MMKDDSSLSRNTTSGAMSSTVPLKATVDGFYRYVFAGTPTTTAATAPGDFVDEVGSSAAPLVSTPLPGAAMLSCLAGSFHALSARQGHR